MPKTQRKAHVLHFFEQQLIAIIQYRRNLEADGVGTDVDGCELQGLKIASN
jgi:hypothetical protein